MEEKDKLTKLFELAKKQNNIVYEDDIEEIFDDANEIEKAFQACKRNGYRIISNDYDEDDFEYTSNISTINLYMQQISRVPLLNYSEEIELGKRAKNGDKEAKNMLVEANLRLVVYLARKYIANQSIGLLDLVQEGNLGLMEAAERYDYEKGYRFSTYATWWIKQAISKSIVDNSRTIRIPSHAVDAMSKIKKATDKLYQELGRMPTDDEIGEVLGMDGTKITELQSIARTPLSLDYSVNDENDDEVMDLVADPNALSPEEVSMKESDKEAVMNILDTLDTREKEVITKRYGLDDGRTKTLEEIGEKLGLTRERVRQIEVKAMRKLRQPSRSNAIRELLWR